MLYFSYLVKSTTAPQAPRHKTRAPRAFIGVEWVVRVAYVNGCYSFANQLTAALNLKRTEVRASVNGFITNLNLAQGTFASQGKAVMDLIDSDSYLVEAYLEETKIPHIKHGAS